jgi:uncharacterized membrane protein YkvA (DUF1232 family)
LLAVPFANRCGSREKDDRTNDQHPWRLRRAFWPKFRRFAARLPFAEDLVAAYFCAFDRDTPRHVRAALIGALAHFVMPFDFIPDMMPLIGFTDDAAILATAIKLVAAHITPNHRETARSVLARTRPGPHIGCCRCAVSLKSASQRAA